MGSSVGGGVGIAVGGVVGTGEGGDDGSEVGSGDGGEVGTGVGLKNLVTTIMEGSTWLVKHKQRQEKGCLHWTASSASQSIFW